VFASVVSLPNMAKLGNKFALLDSESEEEDEAEEEAVEEVAEEEQVVENRLYVATFPPWLQSSLASWVFRLFRQVKDGEGEEYAKKMLARLAHVGVHRLEDMKAMIDAFGDKKQKSLHPGMVSSPDSKIEKEILTASEIVMFLELAGLWDDTQQQPTAKMPQSKAHASGQKDLANPARFAAASGLSARFAQLAAGSARFAALTQTLVGAKPARGSGAGKKKNTGSNNQLIEAVRAAGRNLPDASRTFKALGEAVTIVRGVCSQIDKFTPQPEWQASLEEQISPLRDNECIAAALKAAANPSFKAKDGELKELTAREVKEWLHHLERAVKVMSLSSSCLAVKALCNEMEEFGEGEEDQEALKCKVHEEIGALLQREQVLTALREVAPAAYVARDAGGLRELGVVHVRSLRDALERQRSSDKMAASWSPLSLVRSVRDLYAAETLEDACQGLEGQTADEWAIRELALRQAELAPALAQLREKAIDCELLSQFADKHLGDDDVFDEDAEADADIEVEECSAGARPEGEAQPVILEDGWKLEWVSQIKGKTQDQFRFVDPVGRKYYSVFELRLALKGGIEAVQEARKAKQEARQAEVGDKPAVVRSAGRPSGGHRKKSRW